MRMVAPAATQIGLGDQAIHARSVFLPDLLQLRLVAREVRRPAHPGEVVNLLHWKADELHPRIPIPILLASRARAGQPFLAVEAVTRCQDEVTLLIPMQAGPERFLHGL